MPEICEVTLTAEILEKFFKGKILKEVKIHDGRYKKNPPEGFEIFASYLKNHPMTIKSIETKGKFLYFTLVDETGKKAYIMNTFGLEGMWSLLKVEFYKISFETTEGKKFWFNDMRNFGTFKFTFDKKELDKKLNKLAPDFLKSNMSCEELQEQFENLSDKNQSKKILIILMDQGLVGSGLGNYLVPEILYRAKISPHQTIENMTDEQYESLCKAIKHVLKLCYLANKTGYMEYLTEYLPKLKKKNYLPETKLKKNEEFAFLVYRQDKDPLGNKVKAEKIIKDRTAYWVPSVQKQIN